MLVQILVDNPDSWIIPYVVKLKEEIIKQFNFTVNLIYKHEEVTKGDVLCLLSCEKIFEKLNYNNYNLVIHESDLPKGKGWSPLTWQILEGKNTIPVTLFEAQRSVDSGAIYNQDFIVLKGHELLPEIKHQQGIITQNLILNFLKQYPIVNGILQSGKESFYPKRTPLDSQLDIDKSIRENFNLLRVCDNKRYPAFFELDGVKYKLEITKT